MRRFKNEAFTLIEVIIAVSIFTISIVGLLSIVVTSQNNIVKGRLLEKAMFLAEQKMNEVQRVGYQPLDEEEDENVILDESDEENPVRIFTKEGEFYLDNYEGYIESQKNEWLRDYCWQVIIKESDDLEGVQFVTVNIFNKNLSGRNDYTENGYGVAAQLVAYLAAAKDYPKEVKDESTTGNIK